MMKNEYLRIISITNSKENIVGLKAKIYKGQQSSRRYTILKNLTSDKARYHITKVHQARNTKQNVIY